MALNVDWKPVESPSLARMRARDAAYAEMSARTNDLITEASKHPLDSEDREYYMQLAIANAITTDRVMEAMR